MNAMVNKEGPCLRFDVDVFDYGSGERECTLDEIPGALRKKIEALLADDPVRRVIADMRIAACDTIYITLCDADSNIDAVKAALDKQFFLGLGTIHFDAELDDTEKQLLQYTEVFTKDEADPLWGDVSNTAAGSLVYFGAAWKEFKKQDWEKCAYWLRNLSEHPPVHHVEEYAQGAYGKDSGRKFRIPLIAAMRRDPRKNEILQYFDSIIDQFNALFIALKAVTPASASGRSDIDACIPVMENIRELARKWHRLHVSIGGMIKQ